MLTRAATVVQQVCKSCRTCFKLYCMFYFTFDRSFRPAYKAGSLRTPRLPGNKPTYRPLPHKRKTHITSVYLLRHFSTDPEMSHAFGTELCWVSSVLGPKCLVTFPLPCHLTVRPTFDTIYMLYSSSSISHKIRKLLL